ncbi:MAG: helix-turn-helix domain-containing protein [Betaproteobacteria bacterium]
MPLLEIRNITRRFGDFTAVNDVSLNIKAGERSGNHVTAAACLLGTSRETLRYRVNEYGFKPED